MPNDPWLDRVIQEQKDIAQKIALLTGYLNAGCPGSSEVQRLLLNSQWSTMKAYSAVLQARIADGTNAATGIV